jgi:hypothetical protein
MAHIGLTGAGEKPAQFANERTGHRPLSNPVAPSAETSPPWTALPPSRLTLKCQTVHRGLVTANLYPCP